MSVYDAIRLRRDVRAEFTGDVVGEAILWRILEAAHCAPSVGNTQPWDFTVVRDRQRLRTFAEHVADKRREFHDSLPSDRATTFDPIKIEGIEESGTGIVVTYDHGRGGDHVLGRATVPETGVYSAVLAIQNLWLAATAEGVGVGWVSFYEPEFLANLVGAPPGVRPIAWLCIGPVHEIQQVPDLVRFGWRDGRPLDEAIHHETFGRPHRAER
ncbi:5,6-dimethylbenzimidazole synthase [Nocardia cyriacigeorgica]|uniref:5,6-dimethylbenzimidazole synthase n=1 Tax=Nocardia cyriacigeorgica TaxID=135487 RepID=A0A6P1D8E7_9NOCA|nr:5,6-dimethylbenzimidazole synthase [Nocardia cyriacigeorgica]NEW45534.1 5,6-dimethylbenzimidazole synthase [Nocardia cyriacigeorgica]NEW54871.1 5,6-dimethylbenzimidazole synthase [Nocardia cyriacigeorgica]